MERFIRDENLIIFKRRLAETTDDAQRQLLLKLLAEEDARGLIADVPSRQIISAPVTPEICFDRSVACTCHFFCEDKSNAM
jgi:hypothetical protein